MVQWFSNFIFSLNPLGSWVGTKAQDLPYSTLWSDTHQCLSSRLGSLLVPAVAACVRVTWGVDFEPWTPPQKSPTRICGDVAWHCYFKNAPQVILLCGQVETHWP